MFLNQNMNGRFPNESRGVSMLEVLITILIVSLGLLGMAGLVITGMKSNATAHYRSVATTQAHDIADRMRANLAGVRGGFYDAITASIPDSAEDCIAAECDASQVAVFDHEQWNSINAAVLPDGTGTVTGSLVNGFLIAVMWAEKEMGGAIDPQCPDGVSAGTRCFLTRFSP